MTNQPDRWLKVQWEDGRDGGVLESDFANPEKAEAFKGARVVSYEDGTEYDGPTTHEGMVRRAERERQAEERPTQRRNRQAERKRTTSSKAERTNGRRATERRSDAVEATSDAGEREGAQESVPADAREGEAAVGADQPAERQED